MGRAGLTGDEEIKYIATASPVRRRVVACKEIGMVCRVGEVVVLVVPNHQYRGELVAGARAEPDSATVSKTGVYVVRQAGAKTVVS